MYHCQSRCYSDTFFALVLLAAATAGAADVVALSVAVEKTADAAASVMALLVAPSMPNVAGERHQHHHHWRMRMARLSSELADQNWYCLH